MKIFAFYQDEKITAWQRYHFQVEANSYEEAVERVKTLKDESVTDHDGETFIFQRCETLYDTSETLTPQQNNGYPTREIFNYEHKEIINNSE